MPKVIDPSFKAEQNACPDNLLIMHLPGPQSIWPSTVITIPPYGGEQAIVPDKLIRHIQPGGGQTTLPLISCTQGYWSYDQAVVVNTSPQKKRMLILIHHMCASVCG
jgi:hypothetical protein